MTALAGAVLVGGTSQRMGTDKATMAVRGGPLAQRGIDALGACGIDPVWLIGATSEQASVLRGVAVADLWPGEGPAGAVLTALHQGFLDRATHVAILACDLPAITPAAVQHLVDSAAASPTDQPVLVRVRGRVATPTGIWAVRSLVTLESAFLDGATSLVELLAGTEPIILDVGDEFADADEPGDLAAFL